MATQTDIRQLVPRVRRAVEGVGNEILTEDDMKDLVADAIADVILHTGSAFGKTLDVTETDNGIPVEYATSDALTLPEGSVIAAQAALTHFFHVVKLTRVSQKISDEASSVEWTVSATLLKDQMKQLRDERDKALQALTAEGGNYEVYESYIAIHDEVTSRLIEPWFDVGSGLGGQ